MATKMLHDLAAVTWALVRAQHGVIARWQLIDLGYSDAAIRHRLEIGRLHRVHQGVYAVGRKELTQEGKWMAAVLAAGRGGVLSHQSAAELWGFRDRNGLPIDVLVPATVWRRRSGLRVHRGDLDASDVTENRGIPVVTPLVALIQLSTRLSGGELERAINQADSKDRITPDALRAGLERFPGVSGVANLRKVLDRRTFAMSRSELERRFRPIAKRAGLPPPETCEMHNGWEVDFLWRDLGLVVETDSLRYHRTPAQQARDRVRDQAHQAAGDTPVRFTHSQVRYQPAYVERILRNIVRGLQASD